MLHLYLYFLHSHSLDGNCNFCIHFQETKPIYSFDVTGDYVYDVAWSPIHPAVFASVDGGGRLDLWNLNNDTELPSASVTVGGPDELVALNRVSWTQSGLHVVAGDDLGKIWVYDVGEVGPVRASVLKKRGSCNSICSTLSLFLPVL
jgi:WD40 repeat protein